MTALGVLLGGCSARTESAGPSPLDVALTDDPPRLLIYTPDGSGGGDAQAVGQLDYLPEPDCFLLDAFGDDTSRLAVAWPPGTTARAAAGGVVVTVPGFGGIRVGDWLLGGGFYPSPESGLPDVPDGCSPSEVEFAVLYDVTQSGPEPLIDGRPTPRATT